MHFRHAAAIWSLASLTTVTCSSSQAPTAVIDSGPIFGTTTSLPGATATVNKFLGIEFAQSPPERFSPPSRPVGSTTARNATQFTAACTQQFVYPLAAREFTLSVFNLANPAESEDCLYLNVYAPSTPPPPGGRAVLFWIYGGSLEFGTAMQPAYDGSMFAAYQDVILVAPNYRTNVFGFPNSPELPQTGQNLGFLDQRFALDWVQRNIHAFGGDPTKVTIFGESAGAFSVDALLTSFPKNSTPPFRGAILESGQISYRAAPEAPSTPSWDTLAAMLNCTGTSNLTCIRAAPATTIKNIIEMQELVFNPVADNVTLVSNPAQMRLSGNIVNIPVLSGTNAQEGRVFEVGQTNVTQYVQTTFGAIPGLPEQIEAAYPIGQNGLNSDYDVISQIFTEVEFQCSDALFANATASVGIPSWRYYYNASFPDAQPYNFLGVYHSSEIPQVFGSYLLTNPILGPTVQEYALSSFMNGAWAKFAKDPVGGPGWNAIGTGGSFWLGASDQDLGVLGNQGNTNGSGVTVIQESTVDYRCDLYKPLYEAVSGVQIS
ncbi:MAG: hypothetical protein Q9157_006574 [Trypethelium eluteriae]